MDSGVPGGLCLAACGFNAGTDWGGGERWEAGTGLGNTGP